MTQYWDGANSADYEAEEVFTGQRKTSLTH